ncbi:nucleotidyltransferase family protein [Candidatus Latescibacterota bacterium]
MISAKDRESITRLADRYDVGRLLLFGSSIDPSRKARDIDLAVEGLAPEKFFRFYGDLLFAVSMPVDLVDLSEDTRFNRLVRDEGVVLYGNPEGSGRS